jgi:hypothetical protein
VFDDKRVLLRLKIFKFIYAVGSLIYLRRWWADLRERRRQNRIELGDTPADVA